MRFALTDDKRVEAEPGLKALCPRCSQPVIAKCGTQRTHHWAHFNGKSCDNWWEPETEWHRSWKNNFPAEWQEVILRDERTSEKHIADVRTDHGLVIEFQRSHLDPQERIARENFYQNMVWVVDGTRLKGDYQCFLKGKSYCQPVKQGVFSIGYAGACFPLAWLGCSAPVIFDYKGIELVDDLKDRRNYLYCLFPKKMGRPAMIAKISRKAFINTAIDGKWSLRVRSFMDDLNQAKQDHQEQIASQKREEENISIENFMKATAKKKRRF